MCCRHACSFNWRCITIHGTNEVTLFLLVNWCTAYLPSCFDSDTLLLDHGLVFAAPTGAASPSTARMRSRCTAMWASTCPGTATTWRMELKSATCLSATWRHTCTRFRQQDREGAKR
jgi:hypothetical protein